MKTEGELLRGSKLGEVVVSAITVGNAPDYIKARGFPLLGAIRELFASGDGGQASINREHAATSVVMDNRTVRPVAGSRLADIRYSDPDPSRAQRIVTGLADTFINSNPHKRFQANPFPNTSLDNTP